MSFLMHEMVYRFQEWIVVAVLRLAEEDLLCYKPGSLVLVCFLSSRVPLFDFELNA